MCTLYITLGQHDDARMCLAIALTAARMGASVANHTQVVNLLKCEGEDGQERVCGARVRDRVTGKFYRIGIVYSIDSLQLLI